MMATIARPLGQRELVAALRREAHPLTGDHRDYDALLGWIGDARIVLLGEASHGTHEFYRERARITKRLIIEHGFTAVAIEGDWPDAYRVNRYVQGARERPRRARTALGGFRRFPTWMWRNADVLDFVGWLRAHNEGRHRGARKVGFYGLDLYSLGASMEAVIAYLDEQDPAGGGSSTRALRVPATVRRRQRRLRPGGAARRRRAVPAAGDRAARRAAPPRRASTCSRDGLVAEDEYFFAEQNAAVVAERRGVLPHDVRATARDRGTCATGTWRTRSTSCWRTWSATAAAPRVVVWAHNSHVGDARATEMGAARRAQHRPADARAPRPRRRQRRLHHLHRHASPRPRSGAGRPSASACAPRCRTATRRSCTPRTCRPSCCARWPAGDSGRALRGAAAGARDRRHLPTRDRTPEPLVRRERSPRQYDALVHLDITRAVEPLERTPGWELGEPPETYPSGL